MCCPDDTAVGTYILCQRSSSLNQNCPTPSHYVYGLATTPLSGTKRNRCLDFTCDTGYYAQTSTQQSNLIAACAWATSGLGTGCAAALSSYCAPMTSCADGTTRLANADGTPILTVDGNYQCTPCSSCPPGSEAVPGSCTATSQTQCRPCQYEKGGV